MIKDIQDLILNALKNKQYSSFQVYAFTNENIKGYLKRIKGDNVLSICSSGDLYLNLLNHGFSNIDLVDINPLTEYYALGIKQTMITIFSYEEYIKIITLLFKSLKNITNEEKQIFKILLKYMSPKYRNFWSLIFEFYLQLQTQYKKDLTLFQILTQDYYFNLEEIKFYNEYLSNEQDYEKVRNRMNQVQVTFTQTNILNFQKEKEYDLILCSNILEHLYCPELDINKLKEMYHNLKEHLTLNGKIYASYIYSLYTNGELRTYPIGGTDITGRNLLKEEILLIPSYYLDEQNGVLVLRK